MGTEDEILLALDDGKDLLDRDDVPNRNQSLTCFSCDAEMLGLYCHECGNKNDNYRRSVFSLAVELFQNITAMDSRMWRSLASLIIRPGRMARDFADGARQRWTSPVRLYIAASLLLFGYIALSQTQIVAVGSIGESQNSSIIKVADGDTSLSPRLLFFVKKSRMIDLDDTGDGAELVDNFLRANSGATTDEEKVEDLSISILRLEERIAETDVTVERAALSRTRDSLVKQRDKMVQDIENAASEMTESEDVVDNDALPEGAEEESDEGGGLSFTGTSGQKVTLDAAGARQLFDRILQRPELVNNQVNDRLKLAMFFMMPFAMLMGAFFIRGRERAMLYDHLVHAAYIHAFSFLLLLGFILVHQYTRATGLIVVYTLILLIYLPFSAKRMFGRGWFKSFLTAYGVGAVYTLVMLIVFAGIVALALESIAFEISEQRALLAVSLEPSSG